MGGPLRILAVLCALLAATSLVACGDGTGNSIPDNAIATVDGEPITKAEFARFFKITARGSESGGEEVAPAQRNEQLTQQTMFTLIQRKWIEGEAEAQGVTVSDAEVERALAETKRQLASSRESYREFLRQRGITPADAEESLRIQILGAKVAREVQRKAAGSQKRTAAFFTDYQERWRALTDCREGYIASLCSNAPDPTATSVTTSP